MYREYKQYYASKCISTTRERPTALKRSLRSRGLRPDNCHYCIAQAPSRKRPTCHCAAPCGITPPNMQLCRSQRQNGGEPARALQAPTGHCASGRRVWANGAQAVVGSIAFSVAACFMRAAVMGKQSAPMGREAAMRCV
jgi:hypothetical protein